MKRILSMFLVIALTMQVVFVLAAEPTATKTAISESQLDKLYYLGIVPKDSVSLDETVKRSDFARILSHVINFSPDSSAKSVNEYYYDVAESDKNSVYINWMTDLGYFNGIEMGSFNPNGELTYYAAAKCLSIVLGYKFVQNQSSQDWMVIAAHNGLLNDVEATRDEAVTYGALYAMIHNMLDKEVVVQSGFSTSESYMEESDRTYLELYFDIYTETGLVNATEISALDSYTVMNDGNANIGGDNYKVPQQMSNIIELLGYRVRVYYINADEGREVVYFENLGTKEIVIGSDEYVRYSNYTIYYTEIGGNSVKNVKFNSDANVLYNGIAIANYNATTFDTKSGSIELINNGNGYETVKIYSYQNIVLDRMTSDEVYAKGSLKSYSKDKYNNVIVRDISGRAISFDELSQYKVLSVAESSDKSSLLIINASSEHISGTVEKTLNRNGIEYLVIGGNEYKFASDITNLNVGIGSEGDFYLNFMGEICEFTGKSQSRTWKYGYLVAAGGSSSAISDSARIKIYTMDGKMETFESAARMVIDGAEKTTAAMVVDALTYDANQNKTTTVQQQVIKYMTDSNGKIRQLDTARVSTSENAYESLTRDLIADSSKGYLIMNYRISPNSPRPREYDNAYYVGEDTLAFTAPLDAANADDIDYFFAGNARTYFSQFKRSQNYILDVYSVDRENGDAAEVIVRRIADPTAYSDHPANNTTTIITGFITSIDENGEKAIGMEGINIIDGSEVMLAGTSKKNVFVNVPTGSFYGMNGLGSATVAAAGVGDIVRYAVSNNELVYVRAAVDADTAPMGFVYNPHETQNDSFTSGLSAGYHFSVGAITHIEGNFMSFTFSPSYDAGGKIIRGDITFDLSNLNNVYIVDVANGEVERGEVAELYNYMHSVNRTARVCVYTSAFVAKAVVVYI